MRFKNILLLFIKMNDKRFIIDKMPIISLNPVVMDDKIAIIKKNDDLTFTVNCKPYFTDHEVEIIDDFGLLKVEDIIRNPKIDKKSKLGCLKCLKYVRQRVDTMFFEPCNGHAIIILKGIQFEIRINYDGKIIFIKTLKGCREDYDIIQMTM